MQYRTLGKTGYNVSTISFGAWAIGGTWGQVDDQQSLSALHRALDLGVNFIDTADVYGDGHSERLIAQLRKERSEPFYVATKAGRRLPQQTKEGYTRANLESWIGRSLKNLQVDTLDLLQLHCPHPDVYASDEVFSILDDFKKEGLIRHYGISVETVQEALTGIQHEGVASVQIIFNMLRLKPAEQFFQAARENNVGILARVPLASGLLTGKLTRQTQFEADDHRSFNRNGEAFDKGETFSGVDYDVALDAVEDLKAILPEGMTLAQFALRWITMFPEVTCAIPGAKTPQQAESNVAAADLPELSAEVMQKVQAIYDQRIRGLVHQSW
ncbi:aldo/keto reductase [Deinococcus roseus]|uniref:Aldo/keto reductase n=1 Tax=Deinococcus roseus TaxID=392414 RepID=A0ABQ2D7I7_9DEIO|nr:aldo/keto reductase [Deinococcus roseus]GGJ48579.1 aldo/keto reductase [Deinococcus roseus]